MLVNLLYITCYPNCPLCFFASRNHLLQFALESPPISPASSSSKNLAAKVHTPVAFRHSLKQGSRLMENFLIRDTGGSTSKLLMNRSENKFSPQREGSTSAKTSETPSLGKRVSGVAGANVPESPSTSTLKQVTRGRKLLSCLYFLNGNLFIPRDIRIHKYHFWEGRNSRKSKPSLNLRRSQKLMCAVLQGVCSVSLWFRLIAA